jgi:DNA end-binding protein Ku
MQALWKGTLTFGLVALPVKLYSAVEERTVRFHLVHAACRSRVRQKLVCEAEGIEVERRDLARAYEEADGSMTVVGEDEYASARSPRSRSLNVIAFAAAAEVNPLLLDRSYYLAPEEQAAHAFAVLRRGLLETELVGLARLALHGRERLCLIHPLGPVCALTTLYFADELRQPAGLVTPSNVSEIEAGVARDFLEAFKAPFDLEQYQDGRRETLLELIAARRTGAKVGSSEQRAPVPDLMAALLASLEAPGRKKRPHLTVVAGTRTRIPTKA